MKNWNSAYVPRRLLPVHTKSELPLGLSAHVPTVSTAASHMQSADCISAVVVFSSCKSVVFPSTDSLSFAGGMHYSSGDVIEVEIDCKQNRPRLAVRNITKNLDVSDQLEAGYQWRMVVEMGNKDDSVRIVDSRKI